jgi:hypothetical protein
MLIFSKIVAKGSWLAEPILGIVSQDVSKATKISFGLALEGGDING